MAAGDQERSADLLDQANATSEQFLKADLSRVKDANAPESHPDFDGKHCVEDSCGAKLPRARLKMGRIRCVDCQSRREDRARRRL